jgi:hypothetical protein
MSKNIISWDEAGLLINMLITESIPVLAFLVTADGAHCKFRGFVASATLDVGLVVCAEQGSPDTSASLRVPIVGGEFLFGDKREMDEPENVREELAARYGEAVLMLSLPSGSIFSLMFNP